jgi:hypothetical protein
MRWRRDDDRDSSRTDGAHEVAPRPLDQLFIALVELNDVIPGCDRHGVIGNHWSLPFCVAACVQHTP